MNMTEVISGFALFGSFIGIGLLYFQIKQTADTTKVSLLFSINRDLNSYSDVATLIEIGKGDDWVEGLKDSQRERLLDYISYFEGIQLSMDRRLFKPRELDAFFSNRFFRLANNPSIRKHVFLNADRYDDAFRPIVALHASLSAYRMRHRLPALYGGVPLTHSSTPAIASISIGSTTTVQSS
jgi:hypothetical protein